MLSTIEFNKFLEDCDKIKHSSKSLLGRINKTIQTIDNFLKDFKL